MLAFEDFILDGFHLFGCRLEFARRISGDLRFFRAELLRFIELLDYSKPVYLAPVLSPSNYMPGFAKRPLPSTFWSATTAIHRCRERGSRETKVRTFLPFRLDSLGEYLQDFFVGSSAANGFS